MIFSLRCFLIIHLLVFLNNSAYSCEHASFESIQNFCSSGGLTTEQEVGCDYAIKISKNACDIPEFQSDGSFSNCSNLYGCPDEDYKVGVVEDESIMRLLDSSLKNFNNPHYFYTSAESDVDRRNIEQLCNKDINTLEVYKQCKFYLDKFGYKNLGANSAVDKAYKKLFAKDIAERKKIQEAKHQKIISARDHRGKWGLNFRMTEEEARKICSLKNSECNKKGILFNHYMCNRHLEQPESFVGVICKNFGTFSQEKWTNIENKLKSKYKQLIRKKNEDLVSLSQLDGSATYFALYTNESKNNEPIYIEILSFKDTSRAIIGGNPFNIIVAYHSKKRGEELVKKYKEKQEIIDDL